MSMDRVKSLMRDARWGTLATTNGKTVGVRPMGGWAWFGTELWCATSGASDSSSTVLVKIFHNISRIAMPISSLALQIGISSVGKSPGDLTPGRRESNADGLKHLTADSLALGADAKPLAVFLDNSLLKGFQIKSCLMSDHSKQFPAASMRRYSSFLRTSA